LLCVAGKYKDSIGDSLCTDCPVGKYAASTGNTALSACADMPSESNLEGCPAGHTGVPGSCQGEDVGHFRRQQESEREKERERESMESERGSGGGARSVCVCLCTEYHFMLRVWR